MAEDKKSFVAYADWKTQFDLLSDEEAGKLIKHIFSYVNDENPSFANEDRLIAISFEPIKNQLKRDLKKYEAIKIKRSEAGRKSAELRASNANGSPTNPTSVDTCQQASTNSTVNDNVNVNDTVNVNVNDTVINSLLGADAQKTEKTKSTKSFGKPEFKKELIRLGASEQHADDWIKVRVSKRASFTETVIESLIKECNSNNFPVADAVRICAEQSWQGFKYSWTQNLNNNGRPTTNTATQGRQQRIDEVAEFRIDNQRSIADRLQKHITSDQ